MPKNIKPYIDGRGFKLDDIKFNPRIDPKIDPGYEDHYKYNSQYRIPPNPQAHNPTCRKPDPDPRNNYIITNFAKENEDSDEYEGYDKNNYYNYQPLNKKESQGYDKRYGESLLPKYSSASDMDNYNKMTIPNISSNAKRETNTSDYMLDNYFDRSNLMDHNIETDLVRGMPSYRPRNRSYGYRQPTENYFDYIDSDFQNPDNSVEPWERGGQPTRLENRNRAKNGTYTREII